MIQSPWKVTSAFEFERQFHFLQAVQAVHDPVVFFDQGGIDGLLLRDDPHQIDELPMVVKIISRHEAPSAP